MAKTFILHDETINTQGFRMLTSGADLSVFKSNPVMLLNHDDWSLPIGRWENIRIEGTQILADAVFDENDTRAKSIQDKVEGGFVKAASIGAWPPLETSSDPNLMLTGQEYPTVTKWIAREASICPIGSNHNALVLYDRENRRIDMSDKSTLIRLFDKPKMSHLNNNKNMIKLAGLLNLSDSASEDAILTEVKKIIALKDKTLGDNATLKTENTALKSKVETYESVRKEANKAEKIQLLDTAVKDGRINADGKKAWEEDFDRDHENAKIRLSSIPARTPIAGQVQPGASAGTTIKLADMSFADILQKDLLKELKKDTELYRSKFFDAYGKYPA